MNCSRVVFSGHALRRMFERSVSVSEVQAVFDTGEIVASYLDDRPYPSWLMLGVVAGRPVHVVAARDGADGACYVITAYEPTGDLWEADFKARKPT